MVRADTTVMQRGRDPLPSRLSGEGDGHDIKSGVRRAVKKTKTG